VFRLKTELVIQDFYLHEVYLGMFAVSVIGPNQITKKISLHELTVFENCLHTSNYFRVITEKNGLEAKLRNQAGIPSPIERLSSNFIFENIQIDCLSFP
jgi:hypothetical protein